MKLRLLTNQLKSTSLRKLAGALTEKLGYKVWRSSKIKSNRKHLRYGDCKDKLSQYVYFAGQDIPALPFTTCQEEAKSWILDGETVVARCLTMSSEGRGIVVLEQESPWVVAPIYTRYLKKKREYRVHIYGDAVVSVLEKRRKKGTTGDTKIRNTANGYVFCRENVTEPEGIRELALKASKVTSSDFKGVDIGYNEKLNQLFVIEVNSAPGMQGTTINDYVEAIVK